YYTHGQFVTDGNSNAYGSIYVNPADGTVSMVNDQSISAVHNGVTLQMPNISNLQQSLSFDGTSFIIPPSSDQDSSVTEVVTQNGAFDHTETLDPSSPGTVYKEWYTSDGKPDHGSLTYADGTTIEYGAGETPSYIWSADTVVGTGLIDPMVYPIAIGDVNHPLNSIKPISKITYPDGSTLQYEGFDQKWEYYDAKNKRSYDAAPPLWEGPDVTQSLDGVHTVTLTGQYGNVDSTFDKDGNFIRIVRENVDQNGNQITADTQVISAVPGQESVNWTFLPDTDGLHVYYGPIDPSNPQSQKIWQANGLQYLAPADGYKPPAAIDPGAIRVTVNGTDYDIQPNGEFAPAGMFGDSRYEVSFTADQGAVTIEGIRSIGDSKGLSESSRIALRDAQGKIVALLLAPAMSPEPYKDLAWTLCMPGPDD
ncbi:MAG: hypothetical protein ACRD3W_07545, partial [Terriglobales bacterium]